MTFRADANRSVHTNRHPPRSRTNSTTSGLAMTFTSPECCRPQPPSTPSCIPKPSRKILGVEGSGRPIPPLDRPPPEVVVDRGDPRLDRSPQGPPHIGHHGLQVHPAEQLGPHLAEVGLTQHGTELLVEAALLGGVTELETWVVVPAVLEIEDPQLRSIVDVVLGEKVVVAGPGCRWALPERPLDRCDLPHPLTEAVRDGHTVLVAHPQIELDQPEHVEVVEEPRARMEALEGIAHPPGHRRRPESFPRHRLALDELHHHHVELGEILEDPGRHSGRGCGLGIVPLVLPIDREQLRGTPRDPHHVPRAVRFDQVVRVGEAAGERGDGDVPALQQFDTFDDLLDGLPVVHAATRVRSGSYRTSFDTSAGTSRPKTSTCTWVPGPISGGR